AEGRDALVTAPGIRFEHGGYEHHVVEVTDAGARTEVGAGGATTAVPFGTVVRVAGIVRVLAHPAYEVAFERLRAWRAQKAIGKPAYTVFSDASLREVAARLPTDEVGLRAISGVGPAKLDAYGNDLLALTSELRAGDLSGG
nr:HRDC domain-containing protein [Acidimicrobiia bacterium]